MTNIKLNTNQIIKYLKIKPPFLMIDTVESCQPGKTCNATKLLKKDEWFFKSHLETEQIMPGVLLIEAMLQTLVFTIYTQKGHKGKLSFVNSISSKIFSKASPGNKLDIYADLHSYKRGISQGYALIKLNKINICEGNFKLVSPHELLTPNKIT